MGVDRGNQRPDYSHGDEEEPEMAEDEVPVRGQGERSMQGLQAKLESVSRRRE